MNYVTNSLNCVTHKVFINSNFAQNNVQRWKICRIFAFGSNGLSKIMGCFGQSEAALLSIFTGIGILEIQGFSSIKYNSLTFNTNKMRQNDSGMQYWNNVKIELQKKYPFLTDSDLHWRDGGTKDDIIKELATRIGISWRELNEIVADF